MDPLQYAVGVRDRTAEGSITIIHKGSRVQSITKCLMENLFVHWKRIHQLDDGIKTFLIEMRLLFQSRVIFCIKDFYFSLKQQFEVKMS